MGVFLVWIRNSRRDKYSLFILFYHRFPFIYYSFAHITELSMIKTWGVDSQFHLIDAASVSLFHMNQAETEEALPRSMRSILCILRLSAFIDGAAQDVLTQVDIFATLDFCRYVLILQCIITYSAWRNS